jgi:hypothetical protein
MTAPGMEFDLSVTCGTCYGTGIDVSKTRDDPDGRKLATITCPECQGTGIPGGGWRQDGVR